jgi:hypothetical protein
MARKRTARRRRVASKRRSVRVGGSRRKSARRRVSRRRVLRGGSDLDLFPVGNISDADTGKVDTGPEGRMVPSPPGKPASGPAEATEGMIKEDTTRNQPLTQRHGFGTPTTGYRADIAEAAAAEAEAAAAEAQAPAYERIKQEIRAPPAEAAAYERIKRKISAPQQLESAYTLFKRSWGHRTDMQGKAIEDKLKAHIENMKNDAAAAAAEAEAEAAAAAAAPPSRTDAVPPSRTDYLKQDRIHAVNVCEICPQVRGDPNFTQNIMNWNTAVDNASDLGLTKEQLDSVFTDHETKPYVTVDTGQLHLIKFCDQCLSWNEWFGGDAASSPRISGRIQETVLTSDGHILQSNVPKTKTRLFHRNPT